MLDLIHLILLFLVGVFIYKLKALDCWGTFIMVVIGVIILFFAGFNWLCLILVFLLLSFVATRQNKHYKEDLGIYEGKRTVKNVISNGVVAFIMAIFGGYYLPFVGGFIGAVATATADTMASEIGILQKPRLITTFKKVSPGTDGGVSVLGIFVGIVGTVIIGVAAFLLGIISNPILSIKIAIISGTIGCFMDSVLGAVLERRNIINNEHVNILATITGAVIGIILIL